MNRVYRLVWNESVGAFVAVAEFARSHGKRASGVVGAVLVGGALLTADVLAAGPPAPNALPTGGSVAAGQAAISQSGSRMDIQQTSSRVAINWQSFNIGSAAQVNFIQPDAASFALNRVQSADPSAIFGRLTANGQVMLVNPNGVVFGAGSQVDVGGLVASTLNISDADFMAGRFKFARGDALGSVVNQGRITAADGGYVALLAPEVRNEGVISARLGTVAMAAGDAVALDISGSGLLNVKVDPATVDALVENRNLVKADGGQIFLSAGAANRLIEQAIAGGAAGASELVVDNGRARLVAAGGTLAAAGGSVKVEAATVDAYGLVDVGGASAGSIGVSADFVSQSGQMRADAAVGKGGRVAIDAGTVIQTASSLLSADGAAGGGEVSVRGTVSGATDTTNHGTVYTSGSFSALGTGAGASGGTIRITADSVQLRAAMLDASGNGAGGTVLVGGGFHGTDSSIANAQEVGVNGSAVLRADAGATGNGGQVVVWSDKTTAFGGSISARGGSVGGNGGAVEVSSKGSMTFGGNVDVSAAHGANGNLLLDPHDIVIDDQASAIVSLNLDDPNPDTVNRANQFASVVNVLGNGNVVVTAPQTSVGGISHAGATYLFNSRNGSLLGQIYGSHSGDQVGSGGVTVLSNNNYLVLSPLWNANSASATYYSSSYGYNYTKTTGTGATAGAMTWQNGSPAASTGAAGSGGATATDTVVASGGNLVGTANSLVGSNLTNDRVGSSNTQVTVLSDGNLAIANPLWNSGRGAVTWMNAGTGQLGDNSAGGAISSANSLVGSTALRDTAIIQSINGHNYYVTGVDSAGPTSTWAYNTPSNPSSDNYATHQVDPLTIGAGDLVGQSVVALAGGRFAVVSANWSNGSAVYAGAVTWGGTGNRTGAVSASNSLVGSQSFDFVGSGGISLVGTPASTGALAPNYVVSSPSWGGNGSFFNKVEQGAVTWVNGSTGNINQAGTKGAAVSASNSLIGGAGDLLGAQAFTDSTNYTYTSYYNSNTGYDSNVRRRSSGSGTLILTNGNLVVRDNDWGADKGSITLIKGDSGTFGNGSTAAVGAVSAANSLVGGTGDYVGSGNIIELSSHNFVVSSPSWGGSKGAVTLVSGGNGQIFGAASGVYGATVSSANSLVGNTTLDRVANGGVVGVGTKDGTSGLWSNYLVLSPYWGSTTGTDGLGAVTWGDGSAGVRGVIGSTNSLVGDHAGDYLGSFVSGQNRSSSGNTSDGTYTFSSGWTSTLSASVDVLANGNYVVRTPGWNGGRGAATWGSGASGVRGTVSASNSLVGSTADVFSITTATVTHADGRSYDDTTYKMTTVGDHIGLLGKGLPNGAYVVASPLWSGGRGAVTWINAAGSNAAGAVGSGNSLVGSNPDVYSTTPLAGSAGGDLSLSGGTTSLLPIYSVTMGDHLGATSFEQTTYFNPVESKLHSNNNIGTTYQLPLLPGFMLYSSSNVQQTGAYPNYVYKLTGYSYNISGLPQINVQAVGTGGNFLVGSSSWNNGSAAQAGAVTFGSAANGLPTGVLSATNSLVGNHNYDRIGRSLSAANGSGSVYGTYFSVLNNGNFVLTSPGWNNTSTATAYNPGSGMGAVTWGSATSGVAGTISAATSLVGSQAGDIVGSGGVYALTDNNYVVRSTNWKNGTFANAGAVTWGSGTVGVVGAVSSANSLVGTHASDQIGSNGITTLPNGAYVVDSYAWTNGTYAYAGAVTYGPAGGISGAVGSDNSLVGTTANDYVGISGIQVLTDRNGTYTNYLVKSPYWTDTVTGMSRTGAVTWVNGATGYVFGATASGNRGTTLSAFNSLIGNSANDSVGNSGSALSVTIGGQTFNTGDAIVVSSNAKVGDIYGAITLIPGSTGTAGRVGWRNSILGFNDSTHLNVTSLSWTVLPYAATSLEDMSYRVLAWTPNSYSAYSDNSKLLAISVVKDQTTNPAGIVGHVAQSTSVGDGADWTNNGRFLDSVGALTDYGYSNGLLGFAVGGNDSNAVISPATLTSLLNAGTNVTLQANNNITLLKPVVSSASGHGGNLTLEAGRSIRLFASVNTDNGNFTALANQSAANGVVSASADSSTVSTAQIFMAPGTGINAGNGDVRLELLSSTDKSKSVPAFTRTYNSTTSQYTVTFSTSALTSNSSGDIVLGDLTGANILVNNRGGANAVAGFGNVTNNTSAQVSFAKTGSGDGSMTFSAWRDVVFGGTVTGQNVSADYAAGAGGKIKLVLDSESGNNQIGAISLVNFSANTHGGDLVLGGGSLNQGLPSGMAYADGSGSGSTLTQNYGISITGLSSLNAGTGNFSASGISTTSSGSGIYVSGTSAQAPVVIDGAGISLTAQRGSTGTGGAMTLTNAMVGDTTRTGAVTLLASGFGGSVGSVVVNTGVSFLGNTNSIFTAAANQTGVTAQIGGTTNSGSGGFWLADNGSGGSLAALLADVGGFGQVVLGRTDQVGATSLTGMNLATWLAAIPPSYNLKVAGGQGGLAVSGTVSGGLATGKKLTLATANGGTLALGTGNVSAGLLEFSVAGSGSAITESSTGVVTATGLLLDAAGAGVTLAGTANAIGTLAGNVGSAQITNGQTLTVGTVLGSNGLTSSGAGGMLLKANGSTSDIVVDKAINSQQGNLTLVAGRYFKNNVTLNQGLLAGNGQYWVYSQQPTTLADNTTSARGMSNFSKHYGAAYTGTTPAYAGTGNWFLYSVTPQLTLTPLSGTVTYGDSGSSSGVSYSGFIDGDTVASLTGAPSATIASYTPTAGGYRPVGQYAITVSGLGTLQSSLGYALSAQNGSGTLTVQPKAVALSATKVYDAGTSLTGVVTISTGIANESLSYTGATASDSNVATANKYISAITLTNGAGGVASNYSLPTLDSAHAPVTITPKTVTLSASKTYDGTTSLTGAVTVNTGIGGQSLTYTGATASDDNVTTANKYINAITLANGTGTASNYQLPTLNNANAPVTISTKTLHVVGASGVDKTYDGNTAVSGGTGYAVTTAEIVAGDSVNVVGAPVYDSSNAGSRTVQTGNLALSGASASNYAMNWTNGSGTIARAALSVTANGSAKFVTQADPDFAASSGVSYAGFVNGESSAVIGGTLAVSRSNSGTNGAGTYTGVLVPSGLTAANYNITYGNGDFTIIPAQQLLIKVNNASATYGSGPNFTPASVSYLNGSSVLTTLSQDSASGNTYTYSDGAGGSLTFTLAAIGGTRSTSNNPIVGNYALGIANPNQVGSNFSGAPVVVGSLAVTPLQATLSSSAVSKVYDGSATASGVAASVTNKPSGDLVSATGSGAFADKNVGSNVAYTLNGMTLAGADAGNYYLGSTSLSGTGSITAKTVTLSATKTYDGTASLTGAVTVSTGVTGESLTYTGATANDVNVAAAGKYINAITLANGAIGLASNYQLPALDNAHAPVTITPANLTLSGTRVYDGTTAMAGSALTATGAHGETFSVAGTGASGNLAGKDVQTSQPMVSINGLSIGSSGNGGVASNYNALSTAGSSVSVTPRPVALSASKTYDSTTGLAGGVTVATGVTGESLSYTGAVASDANVATANKYITSIALADGSGGVAGNYQLPTLDNAHAPVTITPRTVALSASKTYDGTTGLTGAVTVSTGIGGESLTYTGATASDRNVVTANKYINAITLADGSGGVASNYQLPTLDGANAPVTIVPQTVALSASKVYDGTVNLQTGDVTVRTGIAGEFLTYTGATANDANVATSAKYINAITLANGSGGLASNYRLPTLDNAHAPVTVTPKAITLAASKVYDGGTNLATGDVVIDTGISGESLAYTGATVSDANVATANKYVNAITLANGTGGTASNYQLPTLDVSTAPATITPKAVSLSASKVYDGTTNLAVVTVNTGVTGESLNYSGAQANDVNVATANKFVSAISLADGTGGVASNYQLPTLNSSTAPVTITPKTVTLAANKVYDSTVNLHVGDITVGTGVAGETLAYTGATTNNVNVATPNKYIDAITLGDGTGVASNYQLPVLNVTNAPATITRAPLTVTADNKSKFSSESDPVLTYTVNPAQLGRNDTGSVVTGIALSTSAGVGAPIGSYPIVASGGQADNYTLTLVNGVLTVMPSSSVRSENLITSQPSSTPSQTPAAVNILAPVPVSGSGTAPAIVEPGSLTMRDGGVSVGGSTGGFSAPLPIPSAPPAASGGVAPVQPAAQPAASPAAAPRPAAPAAAPATADASKLVAVRADVQVQAVQGKTISISVSEAFQSPDANAKMAYTAAQADGRPLPSWVQIDPATGTISGNPPAGFSGSIKMVVVARDQSGQSASTVVDLSVGTAGN